MEGDPVIYAAFADALPGDPNDRKLTFNGQLAGDLGGPVNVAGATGPTIQISGGGIPKGVWIILAIVAAIVLLGKDR